MFFEQLFPRSPQYKLIRLLMLRLGPGFGGGRGCKLVDFVARGSPHMFSPNSLLLGFYLRKKRAGHTHWPRP